LRFNFIRASKKTNEEKKKPGNPNSPGFSIQKKRAESLDGNQSETMAEKCAVLATVCEATVADKNFPTTPKDRWLPTAKFLTSA
jgi:hypothetical protein